MIIYDLETTGLDYKKSGIVSIGAVNFEKPDVRFYIACRVRENAEIEAEALEVNGFTEEDCKDESKPSSKEALDQFLDFLELQDNRTLGGHGIKRFDNPWVKYESKLVGVDQERFTKLFGFRAVDTHDIVYAKHIELGIPIPLLPDGNKYGADRSSDIKSDYVFSWVGLGDRGAHNALDDALRTAEAFSRVILGKNLVPEFKDCPVPDYLR